MNTNLSEFQRVNGEAETLLPLYVENETNKNIISKRTATFITVGLICFLITSVSIYDFIQSRSMPHILSDDCNTYDELMYMEDCLYKKY